jgi:hypothetical protein
MGALHPMGAYVVHDQRHCMVSQCLAR